jgi:amino acid adenylation domain-containing protein
MNVESPTEQYELSAIQEGMLFHHLMGEHSGVDVEQIVIDLHEPLDIEALERAWQRVVDRHAVLRTSFLSEGSTRPLQRVHQTVRIAIERHDSSAAESYLQADRRRGFDLREVPLMRLALFHFGGDQYRLIWSFHHILIDGRSFVIVLREVFQLYNALCRGEVSVPDPQPFRDYIEWIKNRDLSGAAEFWKEKLKGFLAPTPLLVDPSADPNKEYRYGEAELRLPLEVSDRLRAFARSEGLTLNTLIQGAWALLLSRYSGEMDIVFGATKTTRRSSVPGAESIVGLFLATIPVRTRVAPARPVRDWLTELRAEWVSLRENEHTPLVAIREASEIVGGAPLFDTLVVFENQRFDTALRAEIGELPRREFQLREQTNYALTLAGYGDPEILLKLEYDSRRFGRPAIERMLGHLRTVLEGMAAHPEGRVADVPLVTEAERRQLLVEWNDTKREYPQLCVHQLFEEQVERTPDNVALVFENQRLTYRELNARANQLAHELRKHGAGPDQLVGMCIERSVDMIAALLAIIKAGAAYVPLDPYLPAGRLVYMIEDSGLKILLTQRELRSSLPPFAGTVIEIDGGEWQSNCRENPGVTVPPENLALVIYTSGSTGHPKGVQIPRGALINILWCMRDWLGLKSGETLLAVTTVSFDIAGVDVWLPLLVGARSVIASRDAAADGMRLREMIERYQVNFLQATPVTWRLLLAAGWQGKPDLTAVCTGEAMPREVAAQLRPRVGRLWNLYGPTETTIWSTGFLVEKGDQSVLIGRPVANTQCYILDQFRNLVPAGVTGELYIAGDGLARGYLNRPELTKEKFVPNPFVPGKRMYRTGDLARQLPNGNIECLGRTDDQVKIRGFRVELGEIEAALRQHPAVKQAVVVAREDTPGDRRLAAYLVPAGAAVPERSEIRDLLKRTLPDYMVPADYVVLEAIPITPNGKIDRRALPAQAPFSAGGESGMVAPRTETERRVTDIWKEVLAVKEVGIHDNFFEIGGHSLLATRLTARIAAAFDLEIPLARFFQTPTVEGLAEIVAEAGRARAQEMERILAELEAQP